MVPKSRKVMGVVPPGRPPSPYMPPSGDVGVRESYTTMSPYGPRVSLGPYTYSPRRIQAPGKGLGGVMPAHLNS